MFKIIFVPQTNYKNITTEQILQHNVWVVFIACSFSPVPEAVFGEEGPGLKHVELKQDLQNIECQKNPLRVGDQWILLIQTDKHGVHQNDQVKSDNKAP